MSVETTNRLTFGSRDRAPATVLVMVVAMLSALFIVGTAFLATVTFEAKSIVLETSERRQSAVIGRLSGEVQSQLKRAFLGFDGKAWNQDDTAGAAIGNDGYGEVPGVHPLIASIEPFQDDTAAWVYMGVTELESALDPATVGSVSPLQIDQALSPSEQWEGDGSRRDADGDGVWDSYQRRLPEARYSPAIRGDLTERLRAEDAYDPADPSADPDALYYAVRVIPHGGMVDVGHAHMTLLEEILGPESLDHADGEAGFVTRGYVPEGEEITFRRRFILPSRDVPLSKLQTYPATSDLAEGEIFIALYGSFFKVGEWFDTPASPRWWPIDTGVDGADVAVGTEMVDKWIPWIDALGPTAADDYDIRHLLTTVSHDDQLMRLGQAAGGLDWIDDIVASGNATAFAIDDWPTFRGLNAADQDNPDTMTRLSGRLKVSLPGLVEKVLVSIGNPLFGEGGTYENREIDGLSDASMPALERTRFVRTIHDAFMLMLRNVDTNGDGQYAPTDLVDAQFVEDTAAALTANLIDFIDSDDIPTWIQKRDSDGLPTGAGDEYVYGLERQPYITELYANVATDEYAVELFNPYNAPIPLSDFKLVDVGIGAVQVLNAALTGPGVPGFLNPGAYLVLKGGAGTDLGTAAELGGGNWDIVETSIIELRRMNDILAPDNEIVVDRFVAAGLDGTTNLSLERVTGITANTGGWTAVVPESSPSMTGSMAGGDGGDNAATDTMLRPVQIDFANDAGILGSVGSHRLSAIPTTGTLLLLSRYANTKDEPFNVPLKLAENKNQIDNGRLPVFDANKDDWAHDPGATGANPDDPFALYVPWGQLIFDYFTALPLSHRRVNWQDLADGSPEQDLARNDMIPAIDQGGLRVHGRIDINSAPWRVLAGLPMVPMDDIPAAFRDKIANIIVPTDAALPEPIGKELAQSIVAYREARQISDSGAFTADFGAARFRAGATPFTGFLTVGELANVRHPDLSMAPDQDLFDIDSGVVDGSNLEDYVEAVAVLVALGDWVTTRSHVFTIYGTVRGAGSKSAVDQRAIRFQETVDRLPCVFNNKAPRRVGPRVVGPYMQANLN